MNRLVTIIKLLFLIAAASFFTLYIDKLLIEFINNKDKQNISYTSFNKILLIFLNIIISFCLVLNNKSYTLSIVYTVFYQIFLLIAFIDFKIKYVYSFLSWILIILSVVLFLMKFNYSELSYFKVIGLLAAIFVAFLFAKFNCIGFGDFYVYIAAFFAYNDYSVLPFIVIILSLGISGIINLILLILRKINIKYKQPLCPSILASVFLISLLIFD